MWMGWSHDSTNKDTQTASSFVPMEILTALLRCYYSDADSMISIQEQRAKPAVPEARPSGAYRSIRALIHDNFSGGRIGAHSQAPCVRTTNEPRELIAAHTAAGPTGSGSETCTPEAEVNSSPRHSTHCWPGLPSATVGVLWHTLEIHLHP